MITASDNPPTTVGILRDLNNRFPGLHRRMVLVCRACGARYAGDLARYHCPRDSQAFLCSHDDKDVSLRLDGMGDEPLAQRFNWDPS